MAEDVDALIARLWALRQCDTQEKLDEFLATVHELEKSTVDSDVPRLLRVFYDDTLNSDPMQELFGLVVSFPPEAFANALAGSIEAMSHEARTWCGNLHLWTLRKRVQAKLYASALRKLSPQQQGAALTLLERLAAEYPDVEPSVRAIKAALNG